MSTERKDDDPKRKESGTEKRKLSKNAWLIAGVVLAALVAMMLFHKNVFGAENVSDLFGRLSDCFFVPGVLYAGFAGLSWIARLGFFDALSYLFSNFALSLLIPGTYREKPGSLYDYKQKKEEKGRVWFYHMLVMGLGSVAIAGLFLLLYSMV